MPEYVTELFYPVVMSVIAIALVVHGLFQRREPDVDGRKQGARPESGKGQQQKQKAPTAEEKGDTVAKGTK